MPQETIQPSDDYLEDWLRLCLVSGVGPRILTTLIPHFQTPQAVLAADASQLQQVEGVGYRLAQAIAVAKQLTLEGVVEKITCPLLIVHGENDRQVPLWHAEKTIEEAVNSPNRKLKVFTLAEGGAEHCQADNRSLAVDCIADWVAEVLGGDPKGV